MQGRSIAMWTDSLVFLASFAITALATPAVIVLAHRLGWVAVPREDRWHRRPTALMGGIALVAGTAALWLTAANGPVVRALLPPAFALFVLGWVDDRLHLRPHLKLIGQIAAAVAMVTAGVRFEALPAGLSLPVTLLFLVGITNAINLLDNMDGLAAGVAGIAALLLALYSAQTGNGETARAALALAGACAGFLLFNFNPARIFMGDCGSMFLGLALSGLAVYGTERSAPNLALSLLVPVSLLAVPIFDTALVSIARLLHGRSISQGGRDHSSHRLVSLGLSERATVLVLYALTALFGGLAVASAHVRLLAVLAVALLLFAALAVLGLYLGFLRVYTEAAQPAPAVRAIGGGLLYKRQLLQVLLDVPLVAAAWLGAHMLRFEGTVPRGVMEAVPAALLVVLACKLVGLALCRAYRGVWRFAGMADALAAVAGSTAGSLAATGALFALTRLENLSRAALVIDWLLFTFVAVAARTGYVALRHLFGALPPRDAPRVLILGAGPEGLAHIHRLRDPHSPHRAHVVGILDDDFGGRGCSLNGIPVLGRLSELQAIIEARRVTLCLLGVPAGSETGREILRRCAEQKVAVYQEFGGRPLLGDSEESERRLLAGLQRSPSH